MDLCYWLVNYAVSRHNIDEKFTASLFDPQKQKYSQTNESKSPLDHDKKESWPMKQFSDKPDSLWTQNPLN